MHGMHLVIPFPNERLATIAKQALAVDKELRADQVERTLSVDGSRLIADYQATTPRVLRVSVNAFMEMLVMVTRTMDAFE
ncbi:hypothetical protein BZG36_00201 [Bifiguratus adelaidae]|uniref:Transcription factor Pcc1 n=1 Tax=Bifiguratus adelaidae TaxID=1938954 RepID=A0A261Y8U5_9FUNG|nr:hypothetical protein BZG36_00201 [Bifiguratus adelaidae]